ncbi:helix-turn-helix transcriptional regulator [Mesorhizobium kowhaii]|uniref:helix-turn-helix transcriptional regulator n=1 Tax=Mesorhizobium kowhaii TaxID=1300272 RepID=UPI003CCAB3BB
MSFAQASDRKFQNRTITYLQFAAFHFHLKLAKFANLSGIEEAPDLSLREQECILWTARGKLSWEIGQILGISVNTVNFHIKMQNGHCYKSHKLRNYRIVKKRLTCH